LGINTLRVYHTPPRTFLDRAHRHDLKVLVDVPWSKHRCFLDDHARRRNRTPRGARSGRACRAHPALFALSVANEIPPDGRALARPRRVESFIEKLVDIARAEDPGRAAHVRPASRPPSICVRGNVDFYTMNVYLHKRGNASAVSPALAESRDEKPIILGEYGIDSIRNGEDGQADLIAMHLDEVYGCGLAGTCVFSYTDEWHTGGHPITDWGVRPGPRGPHAETGRESVERVFAGASPLPPCRASRAVSVVVCTYNGAKTLAGCLESLMRLNYSDYEVILVDDGSRDSTPEIAARFPRVRYYANTTAVYRRPAPPDWPWRAARSSPIQTTTASSILTGSTFS